MKPIPIAEEFIKKKYELDGSKSHYNKLLDDDVYETMIEFAKLHCEAALKEASEKSFAQSTRSNMSSKEDRLTCVHLGKVYVNKDSILNAYPLTNIK